jgi:hypothetical protein
MYDTEGPYQVFLRYWLGKCRENTNRYHTKIPNRDTTLVPTRHAVIFTEACLHSGGANDSTKHLIRLFVYMVSCADHFPTNRVFKYSWKGADNDMDATIEYTQEKGGDECGDYGNDEDVDGDADDGGEKAKSKRGM